MPIYDWQCPTCHYILVDTRTGYDDAPPECPECKTPMARVYGVFSFVMK